MSAGEWGTGGAVSKSLVERVDAPLPSVALFLTASVGESVVPKRFLTVGYFSFQLCVGAGKDICVPAGADP